MMPLDSSTLLPCDDPLPSPLIVQERGSPECDAKLFKSAHDIFEAEVSLELLLLLLLQIDAFHLIQYLAQLRLDHHTDHFVHALV